VKHGTTKVGLLHGTNNANTCTFRNIIYTTVARSHNKKDPIFCRIPHENEYFYNRGNDIKIKCELPYILKKIVEIKKAQTFFLVEFWIDVIEPRYD